MRASSPVLAPDGKTYDRQTCYEHMSLDANVKLVSNHALREAIQTYSSLALERFSIGASEGGEETDRETGEQVYRFSPPPLHSEHANTWTFGGVCRSLRQRGAARLDLVERRHQDQQHSQQQRRTCRRRHSHRTSTVWQCHLGLHGGRERGGGAR